MIKRAQVPLVPRWSGREVKALREARRMSVREFAAHLGVSDRMVSKWEAGGERIHPRPINQAALDSSLSLVPPEVRERFFMVIGRAGGSASHIPRQVVGIYTLVRHPADGVLMTLIDSGPFRPPRSTTSLWLPGFFIDVDVLTNASFARYMSSTGAKPPSSWRQGSGRAPQPNDPVLVTRPQAEAYAAWAGKRLPTLLQWQRAARGDEGMVGSPAPEWHSDQRDGCERPFRCVVDSDELLALLAI